jgi:hypothetical protein
MSMAGSKAGGSRVAVLVAVVLAALLVITFLFRLPCPRTGSAPAAPDQAGGAARTAVAVAGPDAAATRQAIDRAIAWLEQTRVRPEEESLGGFRFHVMEVHCWFLLYAFASDPAQKARYRSEVADRVRLMGDGRELVGFLQCARMPSLIADLLIYVLMARSMGVQLPALEAALPQLYQLGLDEPQRPVGLKIPLAWLAHSVGLEGGPTLEELHPQGLLQTRPREATLKMKDVYDLTHEIFGVTDYGLRRVEFDPEEQAYLERSLPFWSLFHVILNLPDPEAEILICHQVAGTTGTYGYGEGMRYLVELQSPEGTFGESRVDSKLPVDIRLGYLHTTMVALHALLGHEALLLKRSLPGWPRPAAAPASGG